MNKIVIFLLSFFMAIVFACSKQAEEEYAMITFMIGDVTKNNLMVEIGELINEKDIIMTRKDSFCDIKIGGSIIRVKEKSKVVISNLIKSGNIEKTSVGLDVGKMLCKPKKLMKSEEFLVKTPTAVAGVRGTRFTVEADPAKTTRIKVYHGEVKIAKRVKQLEENIGDVLEKAPGVTEEQKVIITEKEVKKAEKLVESIMKKETAKGLDENLVIANVIKKTQAEVSVARENIQNFAVEDFEKDKKEIIEIQKKPAETIQKIAEVIKVEKESPDPGGRLLVTRYEIYFIKNGRIEWEGKLVNDPIHQNDRLFIASGEYVFCAGNDGRIIWKKKIDNDGKISLKGEELSVVSGGKTIRLNSENGARI